MGVRAGLPLTFFQCQTIVHFVHYTTLLLSVELNKH